MSAETDVLIIGGGPSGMTSALCLARAGVRSIVVERTPSLPEHPKAHELNARSMEILMDLGISSEELHAEASPAEDAARILFCKTIREEFGRIDLLADEGVASKYREHLRLERPYLNLSQTELEKVLRREVERAPEAEVLLGHEWEAFEHRKGSIESRVRTTGNDRPMRISSRYVIAADGAGSAVRTSLGVSMQGPRRLQDFVSAYFEADLRSYVQTPAKLYWILHPEAAGTLIAHHPAKRWVYHVPIFPPHERPEDYTEAVFQRRLRLALGIDRDVPITSIGLWRMTAQVAERFADGRVFLVGDAAHCFPPTGGLGMNTGIADAHNLAWKLAAVLDGRAEEALLDTYETERRPIAQINCDESRRNFDKIFEVVEAFGIPRDGLATMAAIKHSPALRWLPASWRDALVRSLSMPAHWALGRFERNPEIRRRARTAIANQRPHFDRIGLDIGYVYHRGALIPEGAPERHGADRVTRYAESARPGARLPHRWLDPPHDTKSLHEVICGRRFTLLHGSRGGAWKDAVRELGERLTETLAIHSIASLGTSHAVHEQVESLCGIGAEGALLIRPDGHVAWRQPARVPQPAQCLLEALRACHLR